MSENKNTEVNTEETTPTVQKNGNPRKNPMMILILVAGVIVAGIITMVNLRNKDGEEACTVVPQAAFGQSQAQTWTELDGSAAASSIAKFSLEIPSDPMKDYPDAHYLVYTAQISEVRYLNDQAVEGLRISKGIMCGHPVYDVTETYRSVQIVNIGEYEVTEYGDGENISIATWVNGEFSYFIGAWEEPIAKEKMETLIQNIK